MGGGSWEETSGTWKKLGKLLKNKSTFPLADLSQRLLWCCSGVAVVNVTDVSAAADNVCC